MNTLLKNLPILALLTVFSLSGLHAQSTPGVDRRQQNQQERIRQGRESGGLTAREAVQLQQQQAHIRRAERRVKADGEVTKAERGRLHRKQHQQSRNIYRQKNDRQQRPRRP